MPDVQPKNLHQLCYAITSIWTKFSEKCFQHLVVSVWSQMNKMDKEKFQRAVDKKSYRITKLTAIYCLVEQ